MIALIILTTVLIGFLGAFVQSRRVTEDSVMHAAASSLIYGLVEQIKGFDYTTLLPSTAVDPHQSSKDSFPGAGSKAPPYVRVRVNQDQVTWLQCVYTPAPGAPQGPTTTPAASATAASLGVPDNIIGPLPLSNVAGAASQSLTMNVWLWIDEIPDVDRDVTEVKRITVVYRYSYNDGQRVRTAIDREVFLRTRYDQ
ncbi:MAG: hypothetical protein NVV63_01565 [Opitutus sp.]|nr:hypothetical protein [Opitutus sp.]